MSSGSLQLCPEIIYEQFHGNERDIFYWDDDHLMQPSLHL